MKKVSLLHKGNDMPCFDPPLLKYVADLTVACKRACSSSPKQSLVSHLPGSYRMIDTIQQHSEYGCCVSKYAL